MRTIFVTAVFLFVFTLVRGQDTIRFRNKMIETGKVIEIGPQVIKYTETGMSNGPVFIKNITDIEMIRFENGETQYFPVTNSVRTPSKTVEFQEILMVDNNLFYDNRHLSESKLKKLILAYPDEEKKKALLNEFDLMIKNKRIQRTLSTAGPIVAGGFALLFGAFAAESGNDGFLVVGLAGGGIILIGTLTKSKHYKRVRIIHMAKIAALYNLP